MFKAFGSFLSCLFFPSWAYCCCGSHLRTFSVCRRDFRDFVFVGCVSAFAALRLRRSEYERYCTCNVVQQLGMVYYVCTALPWAVAIILPSLMESRVSSSTLCTVPPALRAIPRQHTTAHGVQDGRPPHRGAAPRGMYAKGRVTGLPTPLELELRIQFVQDKNLSVIRHPCVVNTVAACCSGIADMVQ